MHFKEQQLFSNLWHISNKAEGQTNDDDDNGQKCYRNNNFDIYVNMYVCVYISEHFIFASFVRIDSEKKRIRKKSRIEQQKTDSRALRLGQRAI